MNSAVDAASAEERFVRGIDDDVNVKRRDVGLDCAERRRCHPHSFTDPMGSMRFLGCGV